MAPIDGARRWRRLAVRVLLLSLGPLAAVALKLVRCQVVFCAVAAASWSWLEACIVFRWKLASCGYCGCGGLPFGIRLIGSLCLDVEACYLLDFQGLTAGLQPAPELPGEPGPEGAAAPLLPRARLRGPGVAPEAAQPEPALEVAADALPDAAGAVGGDVSAQSEAEEDAPEGALLHGVVPEEARGVDSAAELPPKTQVAEATKQAMTVVQSLSIVLPCANEGEFVGKTVAAVYGNTPPGQLDEIIVVDDGSAPPVSLTKGFLDANRARVIRHATPQGLIRSKKDGGDAARGDVIIFLDCHVRPMGEWTEPILANLRENPKRVVVPAITSLDPDTWEEVSPYGGGSKMCLTWNADFTWCNEYPGLDVPIMSGGLLAMTRSWWEAIGGYDEQMLSWGGENLDQSLRTWLCGGEIKVAEGSRVAHMWRDASKPKTQLKYAIPTDHVRRNRMRAVEAWLGPWVEKVRGFPEFEDFKEGGRLTVGDLGNIHKYRDKLQCNTFDWYLDRFKDLYVGTGMLPEVVFNVRLGGSDLCLNLEMRQGAAKGFSLVACNRQSEFQRFHAANGVPNKFGACCSGMKVWDFDSCLGAYELGGDLNADHCGILGDVEGQRFKLRAPAEGASGGKLEWRSGAGCLVPKSRQPQAPLGPAAVVHEGAQCTARVERASTGDGEKGFRLVSGDQCLAGSREQGEGLRFAPCATGGDHVVFTSVDEESAEGGGLMQLTARGMCIDAAGGRGPLAYSCHPKDLRGSNQMFVVSVGGALKWLLPTATGQDGAVEAKQDVFCVDVDLSERVVFAHCDNASAVPKEGQRFLRHDSHEDGSFQLRQPDRDRCLGPRLIPNGAAGGTIWTTAALPCTLAGNQRWLQKNGHLVNAELKLCVDANDMETPALFDCWETEDLGFQRMHLHDSGLLQMPASWADNGRQRYPTQCLDSAPLKHPELAVVSCEEAEQWNTTWERLWSETPLETRLFLQRGHGPLQLDPDVAS